MKSAFTFSVLSGLLLSLDLGLADDRPHIVLVMADDMGWGQTGYYGHPVLATPHLDAMAANGLRFDRFYAGASNCSPTRATVLTGRSNDRTGVENHGYPLHSQEKTIAQALQKLGYATGHFGKWHLNGLRGPGVPILESDTHHPGAFGFDHWLSATNFYDRDPILSRMGEFEEFEGDSSEIAVDEALDFIGEKSKVGKKTFTVIWYGTPHSPFVASEEDKAPFGNLEAPSANHYGELVAMDRSIGTLRQGLRDLGIADDTLFWFCSDNGGLPEISPDTVGGLRGNKNTMYEGGLRVPCVVEWPAVIKKARVTQHPGATMDIFPTIAEITGLGKDAMIQPVDGISLRPLFDGEIGPRKQPIPFLHQNRGVILDNRHKLMNLKMGSEEFVLYDLEADPEETTDISQNEPEIAAKLRAQLLDFHASVEQSRAGGDYPEGKINPGEPARRFWTDEPAYEPYFEAWKDRPEYASRLKPRKPSKSSK